MPKTIAIFGAGAGLGKAVAHRYAREGYDVVLIARRRQPLDEFARELMDFGVQVHVVSADLAVTDAIPALSTLIRDLSGGLDSLYYAPTPEQGFVAAEKLTPQRADEYMPLVFYSMVALVQQFLPSMIEQRSGTILTAQGASTVEGLPYMSGPGPAQAALRNYLQSLHAEVADKGVFVGMLHIGALIEHSAFHAQTERDKAAGVGREWGPAVNPAVLADLLWAMDVAKSSSETIYPAQGP